MLKSALKLLHAQNNKYIHNGLLLLLHQLSSIRVITILRSIGSNLTNLVPLKYFRPYPMLMTKVGIC